MALAPAMLVQAKLPPASAIQVGSLQGRSSVIDHRLCSLHNLRGNAVTGEVAGSRGSKYLSVSHVSPSISASFTDQATMQVDQVLRAAGVNTNDRRVSLLLAVSSQAARKAEETVNQVASEAVKYINPRKGEGGSLEEALMTVPDLETIPSRVVVRGQGYEIREVEEYMVAETEMQSRQGFDFFGASQAFNTLAGYLFGDNTRKEEMEMTTPVIQSRSRSRGEEMEMTTPVINSRDAGKWKMAFVMPAKYGEASLPLPNKASVKIRKVPAKTVAVVAFPGIVSDDEVRRREQALRSALLRDSRVRVKSGVTAEVAQYNPPFTPPFARRNEVALEVEWTA